MYSTNYRAPSKQQLRSFGLIVATGFLAIGILPLLSRHAPSRWAVAVSIVLAVLALSAPGSLVQFHRLWMALGNVLGRINSKVILTVFYYVLMTPIRMLMKAAGYDPMNRKFDSGIRTYRVVRKPRPASHMTHQF